MFTLRFPTVITDVQCWSPRGQVLILEDPRRQF